MARTAGSPLCNSPRYRDFVHARDQALEVILQKYLRAMSGALGRAESRVKQVASYHHLAGPSSRLQVRQASHQALDHQVTDALRGAHAELLSLQLRMRRTVYTLAHRGEAEAIARALGKPQHYNLGRAELEAVQAEPSPAGGTLSARLEHALLHLQDRIRSAIRTSRLLDDKPEEALARITRAFPKKKKVAAVHVLRRVHAVRESSGGRTYTLSTGVMDQKAWQDALDDYFDEQIPVGRSGEVVDLYSLNRTTRQVEHEEAYDWEYERDVTQDFVEQVRSGQVDAANGNGIVDFMWISVIDDKTDECCLGRDGLSSSEIEEKLNSGELDQGDCDAAVPPGHFNCRCAPSPISDDLPEVAPPDFGNFEEWAESLRPGRRAA